MICYDMICVYNVSNVTLFSEIQDSFSKGMPDNNSEKYSHVSCQENSSAKIQRHYKNKESAGMLLFMFTNLSINMLNLSA